jgi:hypothetical protein
MKVTFPVERLMLLEALKDPKLPRNGSSSRKRPSASTFPLKAPKEPEPGPEPEQAW